MVIIKILILDKVFLNIIIFFLKTKKSTFKLILHVHLVLTCNVPIGTECCNFNFTCIFIVQNKIIHRKFLKSITQNKRVQKTF
jgi:hypothetical protein